jgi:hypothetical protein
LKTRLAVSAKLVSLVTKKREPARLGDDQVKNIAMNHQIAAAVDALMDGVFHDLNAAEVRAVIAAQKFVVIAGYINDARTLARLAQYFLYDVIVGLRPVPGRAQRPAVDDIAHKENCFGFVMAEKIKQLIGLTAARTKMHIGDEQRAKPSRGVVRHSATISNVMIMRDM